MASAMLNILFTYNESAIGPTPVLPDFSLSLNYVLGVFNYYFLTIIQKNGPVNALLFIIASIISFHA